MLEDIVKSLDGNMSSAEHHIAVDGISVIIKVHILAAKLGADVFKPIGHIHEFCTTKSEAKESASERMISLVKKRF